MLEYGETYLELNRIWLRRYRLLCQLNDNLVVYKLAQEMAKELDEEDD